jgi:hypothetical protein
MATGLFFVLGWRRGEAQVLARRDRPTASPSLIVSDAPMPYRSATEHHMTLLSKIFTTRTLVQIIFVLTAMIVMKAMSSHYDFSWASALAAG